MAFLFKRNPKTPSDLTKLLVDNCQKGSPELSRHLHSVDQIFNGNSPFSDPDSMTLFFQEVYATDLLYLLISHLKEIEFDSRKIVVSLFSAMLRRKVGARSPTVDYLLAKHKIIVLLLRGPEEKETSINTGTMLREALEYEGIARAVLWDPRMWKLFEYVNTEEFETSTDAFSTIYKLLTFHEKLVAEFFSAEGNVDRFILEINRLISKGNYVTKRESIKLLSKLIMVKSNFGLLSVYVNNVNNLKIIMVLLGDRSKNIQMETFNVFKVFVANPRREKAVLDVLTKNRDKLLQFITTFAIDSREEELLAEKMFVLGQIEALPRIVPKEK
ncbi:Hym1 protein [Martiniozyma asiatica (nom. inval.)]|nr:Hym1 protein [Martiniozyma asiatica]